MLSVPVPDPKQHAKDLAWLNALLTKAQPEAPGLTASYLHTPSRSAHGPSTPRRTRA